MSAALFFYGSLCHIPLLEIVLGRSEAEIDISQARLDDHLASWVQGEPFPMIEAKGGASAQGVLVEGLSETDVARLRFYEGGFEYDLAQVTVQTISRSVKAQVFFPQAGKWSAGAPWILSDWARDWGFVSCAAAREAMAQFGTSSASEIAPLLPFFRARGWARQLALRAAPTNLRSTARGEDVAFSRKEDAQHGFFRLDRFDVRFPRFDGQQSDVIARSAFVAYDAALVLPYDPKNDLVMLVEQMRYGPLLRGDPYPWVLEPIAGLVDAGEEPIETARREALEEAGLTLNDIRPMVNVYPSAGYSTEFFHCFFGLCDLESAQEGLHGLAQENEDIRTHILSFERAMELMETGELNLGPTVMMLLWLAHKRVALRAAA